ncbi:AAA family ATPase [Actinoplanes sp. NPDC051411]|uniref:AAA family ATPase n=1 Tax=Actinoplanes sp. NPDC051411 TaxID=3155522 RepID=UPI0034258D44
MTALPQHAAPRLVGRTRELRVLGETVRAAAAGGAALLVVGEAGIGKSVLLDAAAEQAAAAGLRVLRAAGVEFEAGISFAGLNQLLLPMLRLVPHPPALRVALGLEAGPAPDYLAVSNAVIELLASSPPVLLIVDDLPWLDRSSALVLGLVARRLTGLAAGLLVAQRTGSSSFFEHGGLPRLDVPPLSSQASGELLHERHPRLPSRVRQRILDEAQGNPLALVELPASPGSTGGGAIAQRLQDLFAERIAGLPPRTRELLLLAALSGQADLRTVAGALSDVTGLRAVAGALSDGAERGTVAGALSDVAERVGVAALSGAVAPRTGNGAAGALGDLDPALWQGLVSVDRVTGRISFRHPLSRLAVVECSTLVERHLAHRVLASRAPDPVRRAWHLADATIEPDEAVAAELESAAHLVIRRGDAVTGVELLTRAAELTPEPGARACRLAEAATIGAEVTGELGDAEELVAAATRAAGDPSGSMQLSMAAASLLFNRDCAVDTPHRLLTLALSAHAGHVDPGLEAEALQLLLMVCYFGGRPPLWEPLHAGLRRLGAGAPATLRILEGTFADPVHRALPVLPLLDEEIQKLGQTDDPMLIMRLGVAAVHVDRIAGCQEALWRIVEDGRRGGAVSAAINALTTLSVEAWTGGRWDEVVELVEEGVALARAHGYLRYSWILAGYVAGLVRVTRGIDAGGEAAEELDHWAGPRGAMIAHAFARQIRCLAALSQGDYETAYREATALIPPGALPTHLPNAVWMVLEFVDAAVHTGHLDEARAFVAALDAFRLGEVSSRLALTVGVARALVAPEEERLALFEAAVSSPDAASWPFDLARAQLFYGEALRRRRRITAARRRLAAARAVFDALGAGPWSARAANELRATGLPRATAAHPADAVLTAQECEIAQLAATGLTNKEIGERLTLSPRTVAAHLYRAFPKLGISSRAALRDALSALDGPEQL